MHRPAYTIVELLTVIGIIAVLSALLLPAVQSVRESGRRIKCSNNIRQLALGVISFESRDSSLPIGLTSFNLSDGSVLRANKYYGMTWITRILPFIEHQALWEQTIEDYQLSWIPFSSHRGMQTVLPVLGCPSDPAAGQLHWTHENYLIASTNYLGVNGTNFRARDGIFTYDRSRRLSDISDGQSNTLLMGERPPSADFGFGWWYATGQGSNSTGDVTLGVSELNPMTRYVEDCPLGPYQYGPGRNDQCNALHFWSYHKTGSFFAFADGAVRLIPYTVDNLVMQHLATHSGGEIISPVF